MKHLGQNAEIIVEQSSNMMTCRRAHPTHKRHDVICKNCGFPSPPKFWNRATDRDEIELAM